MVEGRGRNDRPAEVTGKLGIQEEKPEFQPWRGRRGPRRQWHFI